MKKSVFLLISMMFIFSLSTPVFSADIDNCTIDRIGTYPAWENIELTRGKNVVFLSHPTEWTGSRYFFLDIAFNPNQKR